MFDLALPAGSLLGAAPVGIVPLPRTSDGGIGQRLRAFFRCGPLRSSSALTAERTSACTVDSSLRATCWSSRFIDLGMRMARKTTSSSMVFFLAVGTALSSLCHGRGDHNSRTQAQDESNLILPIDASLILRDHVIKRSRSPRSYLLPAISIRREVRA